MIPRRDARFSRLSWVLATLTAAVACDSATSPDLCERVPVVSVQTGSEVRFEWEGCSLVGLSVIDPLGRVTWALSGRIDPPVTYGVVRSGAVEEAPAQALVPGTTYSLYIEGLEGGAWLHDHFQR